MNTYKLINHLLSAQIQAAKERDNKLELQAERINKQLFNKTVDFGLEDWAKVRHGDFYKISDALPLFAQKQYLLKRVNQFLKSNNQWITTGIKKSTAREYSTFWKKKLCNKYLVCS